MKRIPNPFRGFSDFLDRLIASRIHNRLVTDTLRESPPHLPPVPLPAGALGAGGVFPGGAAGHRPGHEGSPPTPTSTPQQLMDLRIASTLGLTEEDVDRPGGGGGQSPVRPGGLHGGRPGPPGRPGDGGETPLLRRDGGRQPARPAGGPPPRGEDECLAEPLFLAASGLSIGDTIPLDTGDGDYADALSVEEVTIVGTADSPLYLSIERGSSTLGTGSVDAYLILPIETFSMDYYTDAYLIATGAAELETYSDAYETLIDQLEAQQLQAPLPGAFRPAV